MTRAGAGLLAAALAAAPRAAPAQVPLGASFLANDYTTGDQALPSVAAAADGGFVVVWNSIDQDGSAYGVFARRFDAAAQPLDTADLPVNVRTAGSQDSPAVASAGAGWVVAWHSTLHDGSGQGVFARRFDPGGDPLGPEFQVNVHTPRDQNDAAVAMDAGGGFVVTWTSLGQDGSDHGVYARRYDAAGDSPDGEMQVNTYTTGSQAGAVVAADAEGSFVVAWRSDGQDGDDGGIFARRFDAGGRPRGDEFRVSEHTTGRQARPAVASDGTGGFVVAWTSFGQDGSGAGVFARRYRADGAPMGGEFQVNTYTTGYQGQPSVAAGPGGFVVAWASTLPEDGPSGIAARRYDASGAPEGGEFRVNTFTPGYQLHPAVASDARSDFVVVWMSEAEDGSYWAVAGQRFAPDVIFADGFESGGLSAWSAAATGGGGLFASTDAALGSGAVGLRAELGGATSLYVQDDSPRGEDRYRARFLVHANGFDPGEGEGHLRLRIFAAFTGMPARRLLAVVLRRAGGRYELMVRARLDDGTHADTGFFPLGDGPHAVELDWRRASGRLARDGRLALWIDGVPVAALEGLDNPQGAVDFARLGALGVKSGAAGALFFDDFASRRLGPFGP